MYRARDTRLGREVAIKVSTAQFSERFEREARAIAQLTHSNICRLYDVGPDYIVMEYIEGIPLEKLCDRQSGRIRRSDTGCAGCGAPQGDHASGPQA